MKPITPDNVDPILKPAYPKGIEQGVDLGRAQSILDIFKARALPVTEEQRERVLACRDGDQLERWLSQAMTAKSVEEVLAERQ